MWSVFHCSPLRGALHVSAAYTPLGVGDMSKNSYHDITILSLYRPPLHSVRSAFSYSLHTPTCCDADETKPSLGYVPISIDQYPTHEINARRLHWHGPIRAERHNVTLKVRALLSKWQQVERLFLNHVRKKRKKRK